MNQGQTTYQTPAGVRRRVRASLEQLICQLQDSKRDDDAVVAVVMELMRQGRLRRLAGPTATSQDKAA